MVMPIMLQLLVMMMMMMMMMISNKNSLWSILTGQLDW